MVARAVMRAWQASLDDPLPAAEDGQPPTAGDHPPIAGSEMRSLALRPSSEGRQSRSRPGASRGGFRRPLTDNGDQEPKVRATRPGDIVPRRPGLPSEQASLESFWTSHLFWKGIVVGAAMVLLVKTAMAVQPPYGVDWYGF